MPDLFPNGKLPADVLADVLARYATDDPRVIVGPQPGEDAAVLDAGGEQLLIVKSDPITFATDAIGWYAVHVNANDIAASGGVPQWFMATLLLPGGQADRAMVDEIFEQMDEACSGLGVGLIGGHTEITHGIDRPIVVGMMLGQAGRERVVSTGGAQVGDVLLVTKGIPIEATAIIAREKKDMLRERFPVEFIEACAEALYEPGISVVADAQTALAAGEVHALHDPTEGGLLTGLWEMADAAGKRLEVDPSKAVTEAGRKVCAAAGIDPLGAIASGALLMAVSPEDAVGIRGALDEEGIRVYEIGRVVEGSTGVYTLDGARKLGRPARDEITRLFE